MYSKNSKYEDVANFGAICVVSDDLVAAGRIALALRSKGYVCESPLVKKSVRKQLRKLSDRDDVEGIVIIEDGSISVQDFLLKGRKFCTDEYALPEMLEYMVIEGFYDHEPWVGASHERNKHRYFRKVKKRRGGLVRGSVIVTGRTYPPYPPQ